MSLLPTLSSIPRHPRWKLPLTLVPHAAVRNLGFKPQNSLLVPHFLFLCVRLSITYALDFHVGRVLLSKFDFHVTSSDFHVGIWGFILVRPDKSTNDHHKKEEHPSTSLLAASVPTYQITLHNSPAPRVEHYYAPNATTPQPPLPDIPANNDSILPFPETLAAVKEAPGAIPAYETTRPCDVNGTKKIRQTVAHMDEIKSQETLILQALLTTPNFTPPAAVAKAFGK
ncbi:hypothetical protein C8J57DRAFT_1728062 [Mycena rebaudengoi]|nr:hypothetical protein C8J57DRAFT_1728062 [Mycena rebaudengoi]